MAKQGGGAGNRKHGRRKRKPASMRYTAERRWIKNKVRKLKKYIKRHPKWHPHNMNVEIEERLHKEVPSWK